MFDDDTLYIANDEALKKLGSYSTLGPLALSGGRPSLHQNRFQGRLSRRGPQRLADAAAGRDRGGLMASGRERP